MVTLLVAATNYEWLYLMVTFLCPTLLQLYLFMYLSCLLLTLHCDIVFSIQKDGGIFLEYFNFKMGIMSYMYSLLKRIFNSLKEMKDSIHEFAYT